MRQLSLLLFTLFITTLTSTATELPRTGWNLIAVCQDIEHSELDMSNIAEIQAQDGRSIYTGVGRRIRSLGIQLRSGISCSIVIPISLNHRSV